jgi:hypothetical protein
LPVFLSKETHTGKPTKLLFLSNSVTMLGIHPISIVFLKAHSVPARVIFAIVLESKLPPKKEYTLFDEKGNDSFPPVKKIENKIMRDFIKKHGKKPIGSTQR